MAVKTIHVSKIRGIPKNNLSATIAPTINDDLANGYIVGSTWINVTLDNSYICVDSTVGAAVWNIQQKSVGGEKFTFVLHIGEDASIGVNKTNSLICTKSLTITKAYAYAKTAPVGASLLFDINKNGSSIWTTQGNRLAISSSSNAGTQTNFDVTSLVEGDMLTIDIDQVGSTTPGSSITIVLNCI